MTEDEHFEETLATLLGMNHIMLRKFNLLQPVLQYLRQQSISEPHEIRIDQHMATEALPSSPEPDDSWVGWIQTNHALRIRERNGEEHVLHFAQTVPLRVPPR